MYIVQHRAKRKFQFQHKREFFVKSFLQMNFLGVQLGNKNGPPLVVLLWFLMHIQKRIMGSWGAKSIWKLRKWVHFAANLFYFNLQCPCSRTKCLELVMKNHSVLFLEWLGYSVQIHEKLRLYSITNEK